MIMFKTILCPIDGSDHAEKALDLAVDLAKSNDAKLILQHGLLMTANADALQRFAQVEGLGETVEPEVRRLRALEGRLEFGYDEGQAMSPRVYAEIGQKVLDDAKRRAEEKGVRNVETVMSDGDNADQILRCVKDKNADCVVMGSRGLSDVRGLFLGSVSHKVMNQAPCTCIAVK
jgi:nucleotide-binding universal stress UspA family protein